MLRGSPMLQNGVKGIGWMDGWTASKDMMIKK
jgi:hypothetical protein